MTPPVRLGDEVCQAHDHRFELKGGAAEKGQPSNGPSKESQVMPGLLHEIVESLLWPFVVEPAVPNMLQQLPGKLQRFRLQRRSM